MTDAELLPNINHVTRAVDAARTAAQLGGVRVDLGEIAFRAAGSKWDGLAAMLLATAWTVEAEPGVLGQTRAEQMRLQARLARQDQARGCKAPSISTARMIRSRAERAAAERHEYRRKADPAYRAADDQATWEAAAAREAARACRTAPTVVHSAPDASVEWPE